MLLSKQQDSAVGLATVHSSLSKRAHCSCILLYHPHHGWKKQLYSSSFRNSAIVDRAVPTTYQDSNGNCQTTLLGVNRFEYWYQGILKTVLFFHLHISPYCKVELKVNVVKWC